MAMSSRRARRGCWENLFNGGGSKSAREGGKGEGVLQWRGEFKFKGASAHISLQLGSNSLDLGWGGGKRGRQEVVAGHCQREKDRKQEKCPKRKEEES